MGLKEASGGVCVVVFAGSGVSVVVLASGGVCVVVLVGSGFKGGWW